MRPAYVVNVVDGELWYAPRQHWLRCVECGVPCKVSAPVGPCAVLATVCGECTKRPGLHVVKFPLRPPVLPPFVGDEALTLTAKYPAPPVASGPVSAPPRAAGPLPADGPGLAKTNGKAHAAVPFTWAFDYDVPNLIARLRSAWGASINVLGRCYFWTPRGLGIRE